MFDYHVHTSLCNHAEGTMEDYVRSGIRVGLKEICFLDHLTLTDGGRHMSMSLEQLPSYFETVQQLKKQYAASIMVKAGLEIGYDPDYTDTFKKIAQTYAFDVIGSSLHFPETIDRVRGNAGPRSGKLTLRRAVDVYFDQMEQMLEHDYFDVVCHIDLVKKFYGQIQAGLEDRIRQIISKIKVAGRVVELNTSGMDHGIREPYPSEPILAELGRAGVAVTLGSDAHRPEEVGRHFDRALNMLRTNGFAHLSTFTERKRRDVVIN